MKRFIALFLVISIALCSCTPVEDTVDESPAENKNTEFGVGFVPEQSINPLTTKNKENLELAALIYESLFEIDGQFGISNVLCDSFTHEGNTYHFTVKNGVLFSDGTPLTAEDVAHSLTLAKEPSSYYSARLSNISSVSAHGNVVTVTLYRANANLPRLLDVPIIKKNSAESNIAIGTGAYYISYNAESGDYRLIKNPHWKNSSSLPFDEIKMFETGGVDELIWGFESMNVDLVTLDPTGANPLQFRGEYEAREIPTTSFVYLGFNFKVRAFQNAALRRAISCLVDRKSAIEQDFALMGHEALLPVHPLSVAYDKEVSAPLAYSKENALNLFKAAGFKDANNDGKLDSNYRSYTILVNSENKSRVALARRISETLTNLGFVVNVREEKWENYERALKSGDFDLYIAEVNMRSDFNLDALLRSDGALNYGRYYSSDANEQLDKYHNVSLSNNLQTASFYKYFTENMPLVPILFKKHSVVTHRDFFAEMTPTVRNVYYKFYSWKVVE